MLYVTSKLNKVQLCMNCSHLCKQHHLEYVNAPENVNNLMQNSFPFHFEVSYTNQLATYLDNTTQEKEHNSG